MKRRDTIVRYTAPERINHWIVAFCFVLAAVSGWAFIPILQLVDAYLGTPQLARILHPFVGVVMFASFIIMFFRYWHHNLINRDDIFGRRIFVRSSSTRKWVTPGVITSVRNAYSGRRLSSRCCCW